MVQPRFAAPLALVPARVRRVAPSPPQELSPPAAGEAGDSDPRPQIGNGWDATARLKEWGSVRSRANASMGRHQRRTACTACTACTAYSPGLISAGPGYGY